MIGKVTVWYMTEEERLAYIKKHPIKKTPKTNGSTYVNTSFEMTNMPFKSKQNNKGLSSINRNLGGSNEQITASFPV